MSVVSPMSLEEVGALFLGPSSLLADPFRPLLDGDEESALSGGSSSPLSSSSFSRPASVELLSWPSAHTEPEPSKAGDVFSGMDWMTEKLDLSDFDLDSLIGSCDSDESLPCLDLDSLPFGSALPPLTLDLQEPVVVEVKSEPSDPAYTLELGSEVSVVQSAEIMPTPSHIVLPLAPEEEADSDSGISVSEPSPKPAGSSRTKPYSRPDPDAPKVVEKKQKKMEQNKTAATRYRQKKRTEQEKLNAECAEQEERNRQLQEKAEAISREIRYLRDLVEEVRSAKHRRSQAQSAIGSG